jgi:hypothetical protein
VMARDGGRFRYERHTAQGQVGFWTTGVSKFAGTGDPWISTRPKKPPAETR